MKSIQTAYLCWLLGGLFGLHLVYLGRHKQAFVYMITLGGLFVGTLRDFVRMPHYLDEINEAAESRSKHKKKQAQLKTPIFTATRFVGSLLVALVVSKIMAHSVRHNIDNEDFDYIWLAMAIFTPFVVAVLTYLVTSEGPVKVAFKWSLFGSYAGFCTVDYPLSGARNFVGSTLLSLFVLNWNIEWDPDYPKTVKTKSVVKFVVLASIGVSFVFACYTMCLVNNLTVEKNGRNITLRESIDESFDTEEFKRVKIAFKMLYDYYQVHGFWKLIDRMFYSGDRDAIDRAYKILEVNSRTSQQDIDHKCKTLSRKWHPDKYKNQEEKKKAEKLFMEIQQACNLLSEVRQSKIKQNQKTEDEF